MFFPPSPRHVTPARAAELSASAPAGPKRVGLFVEPDDAAIATALASLPLDALQVYASPVRGAEIRARFGVPVWSAIAVASRADLPVAATGIDGFVLEPRPASDATRPGGNAQSFDWSLLRGWQAPGPWLLAGGLTPENVGAAIRITRAEAVDVSSGVERSRGVKDPALIRSFIEVARAS